MRRGLSTFILAFAATMAAASSNNAADSYDGVFRAFTPAANVLRSVTPDQVSKPQWTSAPTVAQAHRDFEFLLPQIRTAAAIPECDFRVSFEQGPDGLLPHLSHMATLRGLLAVDARVAMNENRVDDAVADIIAGIRSARHIATDRLLVSSRTAKKSFAMFAAVIEHMDAVEALTPEIAEMIDSSMLGFDHSDPFRFVEAVRVEGEFMPNWFSRTFAPEVPPGERRRRATDWTRTTARDDPEFVEAATRDDIPELADRMSHYYKQCGPSRDAGLARVAVQRAQATQGRG